MGRRHITIDLPRRRRRGDWRFVFLQVLRQTWSVSAACLAARVSRDTAYRHRERFPRFRAAWNETLKVGVESLELHARGRAFGGPEDPASHRLAIFLLKAHRPRKYRDNPPKAAGPSVAEMVAAFIKHVPPEAQQAVLDGLNKELGMGG